MMVGFNILDTENKSFFEFDQERYKSGKDLDIQMDESMN